MRNYSTVEKKIAPKRKAKERITDFNPIYQELEDVEAIAQSSRCLQCPIDVLRGLESEFSFCRTGCPLNNQIPTWLRNTHAGNTDIAFEASNQMSPFPEILGRVCPKVGLCESSCVIEKSKFKAVSIGEVEVYLNEKAFDEGYVPEYGKNLEKKHKVAIIGSGPAGMSCATFLLRSGVHVEIFEKQDRVGGLLTYGIPNFKLPKNAVQRRFDWMKEAGLVVHTNCEVGKDIKIEKFEEEFDYIFLGMGAPEGRSAYMENEYADGVYHVMEILTQAQKRVFNKNFEDFMLQDKNVVVIGGGDSAMDALRTAVREGAKNVTCVYRRDRENMPGSQKEVDNAMEEGVEFIFNRQPKKVLVDKNMKVTGLEVLKTQLEFDESNKRGSLKVLEDVRTQIKADIIILALGFSNKMFDFYADLGLKLGEYNDVVVDKKLQSSNPKIYAGGDVVRGADLVVTAALDGRTAAASMVEKLREKEEA